MWLSAIALLFTLFGSVLYNKVYGNLEQPRANTVVKVFAFGFMVVGVVLAAIAFANASGILQH
jgi:hypothetical protein